MKNISAIILLLFASVFMSAQSTWKAPKSADVIENPFQGDQLATKEGKKTFTQLCVICHGAKGKGDGFAGAALNPKPGNFTLSSVQAQTDGALFWKLTNGNAPMASYKDIISEDQRWKLVNYIRELGKK